MAQTLATNKNKSSEGGRSGKIIQYTALLFLLLATGVFWGIWVSISRSYDMFSLEELNHIARIIVHNLAVPMRFISLGCIVLMSLSAYFMAEKNSKNFYFALAAILLFVSAVVITVAIEVPINNQVISWTPANVPPGWKETIHRWMFFNNIRTITALFSYGLFTASVLKPFDKE